MTNKCHGCQRCLPLHNGVHCGEFEYVECTAGYGLQLEPIERETFIDPKARKKEEKVPFTIGGLQ